MNAFPYCSPPPNTTFCPSVAVANEIMTRIPARICSGVRTNFICDRRDTVERLWEVIQATSVVLVRGTSCSGKSTLGWLMAQHAQKKGIPTVYIPEWDHRFQDAEKALIDACKDLPGGLQML